MRDDPTPPSGPPIRAAREGRAAWARLLAKYDVRTPDGRTLHLYHPGAYEAGEKALIILGGPT